MKVKAAEESFRKGLEALRTRGREIEAMALFEAAITLDMRTRQGSGQPRYRSYYGLCLALHRGKIRDGLQVCRKAAEDEFFNAEILVNLGRVEMEAGHKPEAIGAFRRALQLSPRNAEARAWLKQAERRRPPVLRFLRRSHPVNILLGRIRHRLSPPPDAD